MRALQINPETWILSSAIPIPMVGVLPVNAYVVLGEQPTLVDTGVSPERDAYLVALREIVDPKDLRWIVVTHSDPDHTGALPQLLQQAPNARVVTSFITVGISSVSADPIPPERALLVRDGSTVDLGDRTFTARKPPLFDNPGTLAFVDSKQNILFSADVFGAPFASPDDALTDDVANIPDAELTPAQLVWGNVDSPWARLVDESKLGDTISRFVADGFDLVLGAHLPPIRGDVDRHVKTVSTLPSSPTFTAPDQAALEAFMAEMAKA